jgi:hypothetical protein
MSGIYKGEKGCRMEEKNKTGQRIQSKAPVKPGLFDTKTNY